LTPSSRTRIVRLETLKHKQGRRSTWRAVAPRRTAIIKTYASSRATTVAARLAALAAGPHQPAIPEVLHVDQQLIVLTELAGIPLSSAILSGDLAECRAAGAAIARWHNWWNGRAPAPLTPHTADAELDAERLARCRRPSLLRLACIHDDPRLAQLADAG
jgi:hypothetical protein